MKNLINLSVLAAILSAPAALASGFRCDGDDGFEVKLYNKVLRDTRVPAVLVISNEAGTLLVRRGKAIQKTNLKNSVRYTVEGNRTLDADTAILQIQFKEGRETLEDGETVNGSLVLVNDDEREVIALDCTRYKK